MFRYYTNVCSCSLRKNKKIADALYLVFRSCQRSVMAYK